MKDPYTHGDVVLIEDWIEGKREVLVTEVCPDVKHGKPGWHGIAPNGDRLWGYATQVIVVRGSPEMDYCPHALGLRTPRSPSSAVLEYLRDTDSTLWFGITMLILMVGGGVLFLRLMFP